jgi:hypothetical protein
MKTIRKVYERVNIHAAKVQTNEGMALMINSMDACSEFAFEPVLNATPQVTIDVLNQLFDNILKGYKPIFHPRDKLFLLPVCPKNTASFSYKPKRRTTGLYITKKPPVKQ